MTTISRRLVEKRTFPPAGRIHSGTNQQPPTICAEALSLLLANANCKTVLLRAFGRNAWGEQVLQAVGVRSHPRRGPSRHAKRLDASANTGSIAVSFSDLHTT